MHAAARQHSKRATFTVVHQDFPLLHDSVVLMRRTRQTYGNAAAESIETIQLHAWQNVAGKPSTAHCVQ